MYDSPGSIAPLASSTEAAGDEDRWSVEVLTPIRAAHLAEVAGTVQVGEGIKMWISERGTVVLNTKAWQRFCDKLLSLPGIAIKHGPDLRTKPIKFLISG